MICDCKLINITCRWARDSCKDFSIKDFRFLDPERCSGLDATNNSPGTIAYLIKNFARKKAAYHVLIHQNSLVGKFLILTLICIICGLIMLILLTRCNI